MSVAPGTRIISCFAHLKPLLRGVVLRVHPDVLPHLPPLHSTQNESSLQNLFRLFDCLRGRLENGAVSKDPIVGNYVFEFWHEPNLNLSSEDTVEGGGGAAAIFFRRELHVTSAFESQCKKLEDSGKRTAFKAQWLKVGITALSDLGQGLGLYDRGSLQLAPELSAAIAPSISEGVHNFSKSTAGMSPVSAAQALRANLLSRSPLVQGKRDTPGAPSLFEATQLVSGANSVFSTSQRKQRVDSFLAKPNWLKVIAPSGEEVNSRTTDFFTLPAMVGKLRKALMHHHDSLYLYHHSWLASGISLGPSTNHKWQFDSFSGKLMVPSDFTEVQLVHHVRLHWAALHNSRIKKKI